MTVSTLLNYQFAWNNFLFGNGTPHTLVSLDGLEGLPAIRNQDDDQGYADGMFSGNDFLGGRTITFTLMTLASAPGGDGNTAQQNYNLLKGALLPQASGTTPLQFKLSGAAGVQRIGARVRTSLASVDSDFTYGFIKSQFTFFCPDPKFYDDASSTSTLTIGNTAGRGYNRVYPLIYGGGTAAAYTAINNSGWATSYPVITLNGPIINPTIGNYTTSQAITINGTYTANDVIVIDLASRLVTLNGLSARNLVAGTSKWFNAPAGASQFYLSGTGTLLGTTVATVTYRSAYE